MSTWPSLQPVQVVLEPVHVAQVALHGLHTLVVAYVPFGQALTHAVPSRNGVVEVALQLVHPEAEVHVAQVGSHAWQVTPSE